LRGIREARQVNVSDPGGRTKKFAAASSAHLGSSTLFPRGQTGKYKEKQEGEEKKGKKVKLLLRPQIAARKARRRRASTYEALAAVNCCYTGPAYTPSNAAIIRQD